MPTSIKQLQSRLFDLHTNKLFELSVIFIIVFSALVTGVKTYEINSTLNQLVLGLDTFITLFFLFEVSIRLIAEPRTLDFFKKGWNVFDFVIVVASMLPVDGSDTVLLARLLRIFRVLRLISMIPELRVLINSLLKALPRMGYIALLMFIIFYIYAAIGSFMFDTINPKLWGNISIAMLTLFRVSTFEDWTDVMYEVMAVYGYAWVFFLSFIFLTTFAFLNMVIGIVVNVMENENAAERLAEGEPSMTDLRNELADIKALLKRQGG